MTFPLSSNPNSPSVPRRRPVFLLSAMVVFGWSHAALAAGYFVDPVNGDDANDGLVAGRAWKSVGRLNAVKLAPGDRAVIAPGVHAETLKPDARGTAENPVTVEFLPGIHEFTSAGALRRAWFVSNTGDHAFRPKPCGILAEGVKHVRFIGAGTTGAARTVVMMSGPERMVKVINHRAEDIVYEKLVFDLKRPSVSEITVLESDRSGAVVQVAQGSTYAIKDGKFAWTGDLGDGWVMAQEADLETRKARRLDRWNPFDGAVAGDLGEGRVRLARAGGIPGLVAGRSYGFRHILHDSLSFFTARSRDIVFRDCEVNAMTNMSFVSQFTENLTFLRVNVIPPAGTHRVCPASMDVFHFANCRGKILVESCRVSGAGDDGMNCHGIHLGIVGSPSGNKLRLRFMQQQTYGFEPFAAGDELAVINHLTLREIAGNPRRRVVAVEPAPDDTGRKDWIVTLDGPAPAFGAGDVADNLSWYPEVTVRDCLFELASCRGILVTSRGKTVIEGNTINSTMPGLLVENDANFWWESGPVSDLLVRNNTFLNCGVEIAPHALRPDGPVHENIRIVDNTFVGEALANHARGKCPFVTARDVKGLTVTGNRFPGKGAVSLTRCEEAKVENNRE